MTAELPLNERFVNPMLDPGLRWHYEPGRWQVIDGRLRVEPDGETDFWQRTHHGFRVANDHFLFADVAGPFRLATRVRYGLENQNGRRLVRALTWVRRSPQDNGYARPVENVITVV